MSGAAATVPAVVLVTTSFPSAGNAAAGIFVARLAQRLNERARVTVVAPAGTGDDRAVEAAGGVAVQRFRYAPRSLQRLAQGPGGIPASLREQPLLWLLIPGFLLAMGVRTALCARRGCVIHANWAITGLVAGVVGRLRGCPVLMTVRGEDVTRAQSSWVHRMVLLGALRLCDRVVTVSDAFRDWIVGWRPELGDRVCCIANGVDPAFVAVGESRVGARNAAVSLITVGSLIPRKGLDQLLEALSRLSPQRSCTLTIVGSGPEESRLRALCTSLGLVDRVSFAGSVAPDAIPELLARADVFVLTSHSEGRPNAVLEAMAAALPVVATDIDGVRELVRPGETGLLFRDGVLDELTRDIELLIGDADRRRRLGAAGARRIKTLGLLWSQTAEDYLGLYVRLAGGQV